MGTEREGAALAAGDVITVNGKPYMLRPVVAQSLADLERAALSHYKRDYVSTFSDNLDLLPEDKRADLVMAKLEEAARWGLADLPQKAAYVVDKVPITDALRARLVELYGELPTSQGAVRAVLSHALDNDKITPGDVKELAGRAPLAGRVRYDQWWVTAVVAGMVAMITASARAANPAVTTAEIGGWPLPKIIEAARIIESLTSTDMGNT